MAIQPLHRLSTPPDDSAMPPSDDSHLRKRATPEKASQSDDNPTPARPQPPSHAPPKSSGRVSKVLLGLVSLALSSYFAYTRLSSWGELDPLSESYALCSREGEQIYTLDAQNPRVQCLVPFRSVAIARSTFPPDQVLSSWRETTPGQPHVRFLKPGQIVVPGLSDSHAHVLEYGATKQMPLEGTTSVAETVERVRAYIEADPDIFEDKTKFVEGWGWDHTKWLLEEWPTYHALEADPVVAGRPVVLQSKDGHALWVSLAVLESLKSLPDEVEGGVIVRDSFGKPTGVFLDNAQDLVIRPEPTYKQLQKRFAATVKDAHAVGLTAVHDAGFNPMSLEFFRRAQSTTLPIRIYGMKYFDETRGTGATRSRRSSVPGTTVSACAASRSLLMVSTLPNPLDPERLLIHTVIR
ncbi:hypothetical protein NUW54_g12175 [Trametes sanguinea]|uniref:Uncharacterized protein n=1 Tax=Trametes sanguinea TaxID=158606 RepID=A0ACC1N358_9APHY|nr:hypothetical protein NUW54_g12175 [Trametes sanguinea]